MKSKTAKTIIDIVVILLICGISQILGVAVMSIVCQIVGINFSSEYLSAALLISTVCNISLLLLVRLFLTKIKWLEHVDFIEEFNPFRLQWKWALMLITATFAGIFFLNVLSEELNISGTNNVIEELLSELSFTPLGILTITFLGPLNEELTFRHAMLGGMLRRGVHPWIAILISSFLFGIIHGNLIQFFFASILGILLGILYTKSQSIIPPLIIHVANNGLSVLFTHMMGENIDTPTVQLIGSVPVTYSISAFCCILCIICYFHYWKHRSCPQLSTHETFQD